MGFAVSLLLIALGAILTWGVEADVSGLDIDVVGVVLMVVGLVGFLLTLLFLSEWGPGYARRTRYVEDAPVRRRRAAYPRRETVIEEEEVVEPPSGPGPPP